MLNIGEKKMKQRLIDANKLEPSETYIGFEFVRFVNMDDIDEMPTVKAIPVEWLKDIARQGLVFAHNDEREGHIIEHDGIFECVSGALAAQVIQNILALWEKENEID